jgi:hypothetical protein
MGTHQHDNKQQDHSCCNGRPEKLHNKSKQQTAGQVAITATSV